MPSAYIIWDRKAQTVVSSSGVPLIFTASADASLHITASLDARRGGAPVKAYDVITVQVS